MYMRLSGLSQVHYFCLIFLSSEQVASYPGSFPLGYEASEQGLHHSVVGMGCCERYGMLIGFVGALKYLVGSNSAIFD